MNKNQQKYTAFMESVCKEFNRAEMLPALKEGFRAFCEAIDNSNSSGINAPTFDLHEFGVDEVQDFSKPGDSLDGLHTPPYTIDDLRETFDYLKKTGCDIQKITPTKYKMVAPDGIKSFLVITPYMRFHDPHIQFGRATPLETFNSVTGTFEPIMTNLGETKDDSYYNNTPEQRSILRKKDRDALPTRRMNSYRWDEDRVKYWENKHGKSVDRPYNIDDLI